MENMKLCAIYTVWDDWDLFELSSIKILELVDGIIVIGSNTSNFGEFCGDGNRYTNASIIGSGKVVITIVKEPDLKNDPRTNETAKRQFGLDKARELGYTHFIMMDADEFYEPTEFLKEKQRFDNPDLKGLVCRVKCYFRSPTLTIGYDTTLVPFIHKITPNLKFCFNRNYPFAWSSVDGLPFTHSKQIRIDPTRSMNIDYTPHSTTDGGIKDASGIEWSDITMHHQSWVRSDIRKKIRNSTARSNIERSSIVADYVNAKPGYFCQFYGKILVESPNVFGLPEIIDSDVTNSEQNPKG